MPRNTHKLTFTIDRESQQRDFKLEFDFHVWARKPVKGLQDFVRLCQLTNALIGGNPISTRMRTAGEEKELGAGIVEDNPYFQWARAVAFRVGFLRKLDRFFKLDLVMPGAIEDVLHDDVSVGELLSRIEMESAVVQDISAPLIAPDPVQPLLSAIHEREPGLLEFHERLQFKVFGREYGPYLLHLACPKGILVPVGPAVIAAGQVVDIAFRAVAGSRWTLRCEPVST
jgi:hypothetical protein